MTRTSTIRRTLAALAVATAGLAATAGLGTTPAGAGVSEACEEPDEATDFVCRAYESFPRRGATTAEVEYWAPQMPARRTFFIATLARSLESREETVVAYYGQFLDGEAPSEADIDYWVGEVLKPNGLRRLEATLSSVLGGTVPDWVQAMYAQYLDREAEPAELTYWTGRVATRGRNLTAADIAYTPEARGLRVHWTFANELQYLPDNVSRDYWAERLRTGTSWLDMRIALRSSADGYAQSTGLCSPSAPRTGPYCI
ncbi:MAG TPA: hypothetical protein VF228_24915 [Iamia sp.]